MWLWQTREPKDPSAQFIRNYFYSFANDPIINSLQEDETRQETKAVLHDHHEGDEKEKVEEMEKESKHSKWVAIELVAISLLVWHELFADKMETDC